MCFTLKNGCKINIFVRNTQIFTRANVRLIIRCSRFLIIVHNFFGEIQHFRHKKRCPLKHLNFSVRKNLGEIFLIIDYFWYFLFIFIGIIINWTLLEWKFLDKQVIVNLFMNKLIVQRFIGT